LCTITTYILQLNRVETNENLVAAKLCYLDGTTATIAQAACDLDVLEGMLPNQLKDKGPISEKQICNKRLAGAQDNGLCLHIYKVDNIDLPLRIEALEASSNSIIIPAKSNPDEKK
jgi:hypothetical protein